MKKTKKRLELGTETVQPLILPEDVLPEARGGKPEAARCTGAKSGCNGIVSE